MSRSNDSMGVGGYIFIFVLVLAAMAISMSSEVKNQKQGNVSRLHQLYPSAKIENNRCIYNAYCEAVVSGVDGIHMIRVHHSSKRVEKVTEADMEKEFRAKLSERYPDATIEKVWKEDYKYHAKLTGYENPLIIQLKHDHQLQLLSPQAPTKQ